MTLRGSTNEEMRSCVLTSIVPTIKTVEIDSHGGSVVHAIDIANALSTLDFKLIVSGNCSSSCSNYMLPLARTAEFLPGALMVSHGGIDQGFVQSHRQRTDSDLDEAAFEGLTETARKQAEFSKRHKIAPGWLITRRAQDYGKPALGLYISGEPENGGISSKGPLKYFLIDEAFLRSCLPDLTFTGLEQARIGQARRDPKVENRLAKAGIYPTGTMRCVPGPFGIESKAEPDAP